MDLVFILLETEPELAAEWIALLAKTGNAALKNEGLRDALKAKLLAPAK